MNYFELFGIPQEYSIDSARLAERYRDLQRAVHPDKFADASDAQRRLSVQKTAQVNDAYQTLKNPIRRAEHLLELAGVELAAESETLKDMSFLMQQMSWREAMDEVKSASDPFAAVDELASEFDQARGQMEQELKTALAQGNDEAHAHAAELVRKLKFMAKLSNELDQLEDTL
ncbi:co-chaperone HscB [Paraferrimonas sedimenticola]|uniref:Co-chaperone protein HscB homolog n=1 Tax=Paraferrimonas sedimenticola TaxID=375674 RepID=A0AA37RTS2_9GAMM|nr:co-chaperone HscB [Paraferrimonas sedimenticola]GLP95179.1 co-chaperone protein HscB [Paraferrimonas sedimenticola]